MQTPASLNSFAEPVEKAITDTVNMGRQTFSKVAESVWPTTKDVYHEVEKAVGDIVEKTSNSIKKYPLSSIAIGFGAGCLVGLALRGFHMTSSKS